MIIFWNRWDVKETRRRKVAVFEDKMGLDKGNIPCYNTQALKRCARYRGVEQLEARRAHNPEVVGSSPASATIKTPDFERNPVFF